MERDSLSVISAHMKCISSVHVQSMKTFTLSADDMEVGFVHFCVYIHRHKFVIFLNASTCYVFIVSHAEFMG